MNCPRCGGSIVYDWYDDDQICLHCGHVIYRKVGFMTGKEAIERLQAAGFTLLYVDSSGHQHLGRGEDTMMISSHKQSLDSNIAQDVVKLCRGGTPTHVAARTTRRMEVYGKPVPGKTTFVALGKVELKKGDQVRLIAKPDTKGIVEWINPKTQVTTIRWSSGLTNTMNRDVLQKEEGMPEEETKTTETLWDKLVDLGGVAATERILLGQIYEELRERVAAYERVRSISENIQVPIDPLPFSLDGTVTEEEIETTPPPTEAEEVEVKLAPEDIRIRPPRRVYGDPIKEEHIVSWIRYEGDFDWTPQGDVIKHFAGHDSPVAKEIIDKAVTAGRIHRTTQGHGKTMLKLVEV